MRWYAILFATLIAVLLAACGGGDTWDRLIDGLPGPHDYQSSYREGMDTDGLDPEGVYAGTSNGQV